MRSAALLAVLAAVVPAAALAQATVPESALSGPAYSLKPGAASPNANVLGNSGVQTRTPTGPHVAPGTAGADIPKQPLSEARAGDPVLRAYVLSLQQKLPAHGYHPGPATGRLDPETERAIRAYQRDAGITQNARSTWVLQQTLDSVSFARPQIMARTGGKPVDQVAYVQQQLAVKGYDPGPADGKLGRRTVTAIENFQGDRGLARDGRISPHLVDLLGKS